MTYRDEVIWLLSDSKNKTMMHQQLLSKLKPQSPTELCRELEAMKDEGILRKRYSPIGLSKVICWDLLLTIKPVATDGSKLVPSGTGLAFVPSATLLAHIAQRPVKESTFKPLAPVVRRKGLQPPPYKPSEVTWTPQPRPRLALMTTGDGRLRQVDPALGQILQDMGFAWLSQHILTVLRDNPCNTSEVYYRLRMLLKEKSESFGMSDVLTALTDMKTDGILGRLSAEDDRSWFVITKRKRYLKTQDTV